MAIRRKMQWAMPLAVLVGLVGVADLIVAEDNPPAGNQPAETKSATRTPAQIFTDLDKNGDGKLPAGELPPEHQRLFQRLLRITGKEPGSDLTQAEFVAAFKPDDLRVAAPQNLGNGGGRGNIPDRAQIFTRLDRNKDGKLTLDEVPEQNPGIRRLFTQLNKTQLSREDVVRAAGMMRPGAGRGGLPSLLFRKLDTNGDGKLSKDEFSKAADLFDEFDRDHNGQLEPAELVGPPPTDARPDSRPRQDTQKDPTSDKKP